MWLSDRIIKVEFRRDVSGSSANNLPGARRIQVRYNSDIPVLLLRGTITYFSERKMKGE